MNRRLFLIAALVSILARAPANADDPLSGIDWYLLPIASAAWIPGGYGSLWATELLIRNDSADSIYLPTPAGTGCVPEACGPEEIAPNKTVQFQQRLPGNTSEPWNHAVFLYLAKGDRAALQVTLRIRDVSVDPARLPVELPLVHSSEFRIGTIGLLDVPTRPGTRTLIRIFVRPTNASDIFRFKIETYDSALDVPLETAEVATRAGDDRPLARWATTLQWAPTNVATRGLRVVIAELGHETPFWAFATTTDNLTQEIALTTPQLRYVP
ncbi:MAG TPA: hypothetical protein VIL97_02945 [Thermoanaerobaculia bacterium]